MDTLEFLDFFLDYKYIHIYKLIFYYYHIIIIIMTIINVNSCLNNGYLMYHYC